MHVNANWLRHRDCFPRAINEANGEVVFAAKDIGEPPVCASLRGAPGRAINEQLEVSARRHLRLHPNGGGKIAGPHGE